MFSNYKIVACTAAGRMRYMQYVFPYVLACDIIDRYDIWVNTRDMMDTAFFKAMADRYEKVRLVPQPDGIVDGVRTINAFYRACVEPDTIYIKIDDDVVWMQPGTMERMIAFRIQHEEAFLVSPVVVNNPMCTYVWQVKGKFDYGRYLNAKAIHRSFWKRGAAAAVLHDHFLSRMEQDPEYYRTLHVGPVPSGCCRFSINYVLWFGRDMARMAGDIPGDDEEFLSSIIAPRMGRYNLFDGDCVIAHFAFAPQRVVLDKTRTLERYGALCEQAFMADAKMAPIWQYIQQCWADLAARAEEIRATPCPYPAVRKSPMEQLRQRFKAWQRNVTYHYERWRGVRYSVKDGDLYQGKYPTSPR